MKKYFLIVLVLPIVAFAQYTAQDFIDKGVKLHDQGKFAEAIESYKQALDIEKDNPKANYEIALTYTSLKEHEAAIEHAEKLIKSKSDLVGQGHHLKGINLDYIGKPKEAISAFKKGIKAAPGYTTLYYSLAITSYTQKDVKTAEKALHDAILTDPLHINSHYMLGLIKQEERSKSLLALYRFLLLEPTGTRANNAYNMILSMHKIGVEVVDEKHINVTIGGINDDNEFSTAEMMLSLMEASKSTEEKKGKSDFELFSENTRSFFKILGEINENEKNKGFWWDYYVPFFYSIAKDDTMYEAYINYISKDMNYTAVDTWLQNNQSKVDKMLDWSDSYEHHQD